MNYLVLSYALVLLALNVDGFLHSKKFRGGNSSDTRLLATVKIYSNLAEIIQPLSKLPLEFTTEDWSNIRPDSITLVGANVTIMQQTITEKKKSQNNVEVHVRSPSSSSAQTKFIKATLVDEKRNLVKLVDKDISKDPIYFTASHNDIVYDTEPPQSKYYVNFTYDTSDAVYVSYLRSNLNWKTRYQLNLFEDAKSPALIVMGDIRNDGHSALDIEHAELLGGDINLQMGGQSNMARYSPMIQYDMAGASNRIQGIPGVESTPKISQAEELAGLYVFTVDQPFSIEAQTNYLLPMFRPRVTVDRYASISESFYGNAANTNGKAQRSYRLISDRFLTRGNCIIRESDRLVGETSIPDLAAKDKLEFSIGQDADITYKQNSTLVSSRTYNETITPGSRVFTLRTQSTFNMTVLLKNFKKTRAVKVEYHQHIYGQSVKLIGTNAFFTQDGSKIKGALTLAADEEKILAYKVEIIN